eukprot:4387994-Pyramimonas_sp.AAC.1
MVAAASAARMRRACIRTNASPRSGPHRKEPRLRDSGNDPRCSLWPPEMTLAACVRSPARQARALPRGASELFVLVKGAEGEGV